MAVAIEQNEQGIEVAVVREDGPDGTVRAVYINEVDVEIALRYMAVDMDLWGCHEAFCEACNPARMAWWTLSNSLSKAKRIELQSLLRDACIPLPEAPYDEE